MKGKEERKKKAIKHPNKLAVVERKRTALPTKETMMKKNIKGY